MSPSLGRVTEVGYNRAQLLSGELRHIIAPADSVALAVNPSDIFDQVFPYALKTGYLELGATTDSTSYELGLDAEDWFIKQSSLKVGQRINEVMRSISTTLAQVSAQNTRLAEEGGADTAIAAAAGRSAWTRVRTGAISARTPYRLALVGQRAPEFGGGLVTEPGGGKRPTMFVCLAHYALIAAEDQEMEFDAEDLVGREVQWDLYPEDSITVANENTVSWFFEAPGVIAL